MTLCRIILGVAAVAVLSSCGSKSDVGSEQLRLSEHTLTLKAGQTAKLEVTGVPGASWKSSSDFVADVTGGYVEARHVGKTTIRATYDGMSDECEVTVTPKYNILLDDLVLDFGATAEQIKAKEPGTYIERGETTDGGYYDLYERSGGQELTYIFPKTDYKLYSVSQDASGTLNLVDVYAAVAERYEILSDAPSDMQIYYHPDKKVYMVLYKPTINTMNWLFYYTANRWWDK